MSTDHPNRRPTPKTVLPGFSLRGTTRTDDLDRVLGDFTAACDLTISELREGELAVAITTVYHGSAPTGPPCFNAAACESLARQLTARAEALRAAETAARETDESS